MREKKSGLAMILPMVRCRPGLQWCLSIPSLARHRNPPGRMRGTNRSGRGLIYRLQGGSLARISVNVSQEYHGRVGMVKMAEPKQIG
jgi:hypothetical protein